MPNWNWQLILSIACVVWATLVLVRGSIRFWKGQHGTSCGSEACGDCPAGEDSQAGNSHRDIIPLQPLRTEDSDSHR